MKDPPTQPEALEERVLRHARVGLGPSASQRQATLARLSASLSLGGLAPPTPPESVPLESMPPGSPGANVSVHTTSSTCPPTQLIAGGVSRSLIAGLVSGSLVSLGAASYVAWSDPSPSGVPAPAVPSAPLHKPAPSPTLPSPTSAPPPVDAPAPPLSPPSQRNHQPPKPPSPPKPPTPAISAPQAEPTFYEELALVRQAQSALQRGDALFALGLMNTLDKEQPRGAMLAERNVTRVLALCQLGRNAEAVAVVRRLSTDTSTTIYRRRLAGSCAGTGLPRERSKQKND